MQIHELNNFTGTLGAGAYLAIDDGNDTGKISSQGLLAATEARIDNIIAGPAPSAEEIIDARLGDDGVTYPSLGDAIRDQFSDVKSEITQLDNDLSTEEAARIYADNVLSTSVSNLGTHKVAQPLDEYNQPTDGTDGQSLRTKGDGTTEWADVGLPTDAQTAQAVSDWLDEHPEATTTVQDESLTEAKFSDSLKLKTIKDYVTPEMFGAKGDGVTDDTQSLQDALDSGQNVCLSFGKQYLITSSLYVKDLVNRKGRTIFSNALVAWKPLTSLICRFQSVQPVFVIQDDGITFQNITIDATNTYDSSRTLTVFKTDIEAVDVDMTITECAIFGASVIVDIVGRGLRMVNNVVAASSRIAKIGWKYESDTPWHDDATGMRAYIIDNNRFHSMSTTSFPLIEVESGNAYGFHFCGNVLDRGYSSLVHATEDVNNWIISDNVFNGINGYGTYKSFLTFDGKVDQLVFTNNNITNNIGGVAANIVLCFLKAINRCIIANNNTDCINNGNFIQLIDGDVSNTVIIGNIIGEILAATTHRGLLTIANSHDIKQTTFVGNVIEKITSANATTRYAYVVRSSGTVTLEKVRMFGNVVQSNTSLDYSISYPTTTDCRFDFS